MLYYHLLNSFNFKYNHSLHFSVCACTKIHIMYAHIHIMAKVQVNDPVPQNKYRIAI